MTEGAAAGGPVADGEPAPGGGPGRRRTVALRSCLGAYLAAVLLVTMWPSPHETAAPSWAQAVLGAAHGIGLPLTFEVLEALANVVMFVPLGVLLVALRVRPGAATLTGLALSALIEVSQLLVPGRVSTLQDVAMNTAGGALGAVAAAAGRRCTARRAGGRP